MDDKVELYSALASAQADFDEPKKTKKAFNYFYAPMEEVRRAITPTLNKFGLSVIQFPISKDGMIGVKTILAHKSGQSIEEEFLAEPLKRDPQSIGSAITYFRRYATLAVLGLAPEDDDGETAMPNNGSFKHYDEPGEFVVTMGKKYNGKKIKDIPKSDLISYISWIEGQGSTTPTGRDVVKFGKAFLGIK